MTATVAALPQLATSVTGTNSVPLPPNCLACAACGTAVTPTGSGSPAR